MSALQEKLRSERLVQSLEERVAANPEDWRGVDLLLLALAQAGMAQRAAEVALEEIGRTERRPWDPKRARWLIQVHNAALEASKRAS